MADTGETPLHIPGNLSPSALGGDNRTDLGRFATPGNLPAGFHPDASTWLGDERYEVNGNDGGLGTAPVPQTGSSLRGMGDNTKKR